MQDDKWLMEIFDFSEARLFLKEFDLESTPEGSILGTYIPQEAMQFDNAMHVMETWRTVSKRFPVRIDGLPNRPLSVMSISPVRLIDAFPRERATRPN